MTDTFIVDRDGEYTVGKAQTTPENEAEGLIESFDDALSYWGTSVDESASALRGTAYSGTAMINRLLEREGDSNIGVITNRGFEDTLRLGRGIQSWVDLSYSGRLHAREHMHPETIVPRENVKGVRCRTHTSGEAVIPVYEDEARAAIEELLDKDVRVICVSLLYSFLNDSHEQRIKEIAEEVKREKDDDTPVWLSSEQKPIEGELSRLNTLVLEAYAVEPSRQQFYNIEEALESKGANSPFRIVTASGGTISPEHDWLADTMISGPIGGIFGGEYLADELGISNLVCSDVGGTSFDVGLITRGHYPTRWDESMDQLMINIPMTAMDTIGSGTGSYVRVDSTSGRLEVGPDSAGYQVGVANKDAGLETPTVTDCTAALGYLNPDYFLGGDIDLDIDRAREYIEEQLADPLGQDVDETARGVLDVVERDMVNELRGMILGLGYSPENYNLVSYGGGGPLHTAGYTKPLEFKDVLVPEWASAFSAFGCSTADYAYRYDRSLNLEIEPDFSNADAIVETLNQTLTQLEEQTIEAFERDDIKLDQMEFEPALRMQYTGMLEDLEVSVPSSMWSAGGLSAKDIKQITDQYDREFGQIFQRAAQSPERGYTITMVVGTGVAPSPDPTMPNETEVKADDPPNSAHKTQRPIYYDGDWHDADIWEMNEIDAGNIVTGPAVVEAPSTTFLVPPGFTAPLDSRRIFHLNKQ